MYSLLRVVVLSLSAVFLFPHSVIAADLRGPSKAVVATALLSGLSLFKFDSDELTPEGNRAIEQLMDKLASFQSIQSIRIVGHTDSRGPESYNLDLSMRRANFIRVIVKEKYPAVSVVSIGAGESIPIATNKTDQGRRQNRRVEIEIVAKGIRQKI